MIVYISRVRFQKPNTQLFFTTHNLEIYLPTHYFIFKKSKKIEVVCVSEYINEYNIFLGEAIKNVFYGISYLDLIYELEEV